MFTRFLQFVSDDLAQKYMSFKSGIDLESLDATIEEDETVEVSFDVEQGAQVLRVDGSSAGDILGVTVYINREILFIETTTAVGMQTQLSDEVNKLDAAEFNQYGDEIVAEFETV